MNRKITAAAIALAIITASGYGLYKWMNNDDEAQTPATADQPAAVESAAD